MSTLIILTECQDYKINPHCTNSSKLILQLDNSNIVQLSYAYTIPQQLTSNLMRRVLRAAVKSDVKTLKMKDYS